MDRLIEPIRPQLQLFEARLDAALEADVDLAHQIARYLAALHGKRLRPALALLGARAVGLEDDRIIDAAVAVEMIHAATMIHDDVVDSASMRRGKASVSSAWSGQLAVLMGDFLLSRALCMLVSVGNAEALEALARRGEEAGSDAAGFCRRLALTRDGDLYRRNQQVVGLIDWGDMVHSITVADLAVAIAYAVLDCSTRAELMAAASQIVRGYHAECPLVEEEVAAEPRERVGLGRDQVTGSRR